MATATIVWCLACMLAFLFGWMRGRNDLSADIDPHIDKLHEVLREAAAKGPPPCKRCGHASTAPGGRS